MINSSKLNFGLRIVLATTGTGLMLLSYNNCSSGVGAKSSTAQSNSSQTASASQINPLIQIQSGGTTTCSTSGSTCTIPLKNSTFTVQALGTYPAGATAALIITASGTSGTNKVTLPMNLGQANTFTMSQLGAVVSPGMSFNLTIEVTEASGAVATRTQSGQFQCPVTPLQAGQASGGSLSVAAGSKPNLYSYAVTLPTNLPGQADSNGNYTCTLDPTGTGALDTVSIACKPGSQVSFGEIYSNYVGARSPSVVISDSCQGSATITQNKVLPYPAVTNNGTPVALKNGTQNPLALGGGINFITGEVSATQGALNSDSRVTNMVYLATNSAPNQTVVYTKNGHNNGNTTLNIVSSLDYAQAYGLTSTHKPIGITLNLAIPGTVTAGTNASTLNLAQAYASASFSTDEAAGASPQFQVSSTSNCTLSNMGSKFTNLTSAPCGSGQSGNQASTTVEIWGTYTCVGMSDGVNADTMTMSGAFDGLYNEGTSCGGGGGGGGSPPVGF